MENLSSPQVVGHHEMAYIWFYHKKYEMNKKKKKNSRYRIWFLEQQQKL